MKKFEINKVYGMNSICDSYCWWYYRVESRTNSTVTMRQLKSDGTEYSETIKCKISAKLSKIYGAEAVKPLGSYSMCPTLTAEKVIENLGEMEKLNKAFLEAYDEYYQNSDSGDYEEMYAAGCQIIDDKEMHPLLSEFARYRRDYITSDREIAAFAKAYTKIHHTGYKVKVHKQGVTPEGKEVKVIERYNQMAVSEGISLLYDGEEIEYSFLETAITQFNDLVKPVKPKAKAANMGVLIIGGVKVCEFSHHEI